MGKHKTSTQDSIFLTFMEEHQDIARGFVKGDKVVYEGLWSNLATELNASGPPTKDVGNWKKAWIDWKGNIRRKLAHNKAEAKATGGGPFNQIPLTRVEEELAVICGFHTTVEGVANSQSFGTSHFRSCSQKNKSNATGRNMEILNTGNSTSTENIQQQLQSTASTSEQTSKSPTSSNLENIHFNITREVEASKSPTPLLSTHPITPERKRRAMDINYLLEKENQNISLISKKLDEMRESQVEDRKVMQRIENILQDLKTLKKKEVDEQMRHHLQIERSLVTKNEIKLQILEIEKSKLDILKDN